MEKYEGKKEEVQPVLEEPKKPPKIKTQVEVTAVSKGYVWFKDADGNGSRMLMTKETSKVKVGDKIYI